MRTCRPTFYSLALLGDAEADLDRLFDEQEEAAASIAVFLDEAKSNQSTLENLSRNGFIQFDDPKFDVKEWVEQKKSKRNLWRLRLWTVKSASSYRVVYAFHPVQMRYYVLGIVHRDFDYAAGHATTHRILDAYDALAIPGY